MRSSVASAFWLIFLALAPASPASAQPMRRTPDGVVVTVPYVVRMHVADQRFEVVTKEIGPFADGAWRDALPSRVPVVTVFPDGRAERGFYIYNRFDKAVVSIPYERPSSVLYDGKNGYRASTSVTYSGPRLEQDGDSWVYRGATWAVGATIRLASEDYFHVYYSAQLVAGAPDGPWTLAYLLRDSYAMPSGVLRGGRTYSWVITGVNQFGTAPSLPSTFTTASCYPDCNDDGALNLADHGCFQTKYALGDPYADCNGDQVLNLADYGCFQTKFALGCP